MLMGRLETNMNIEEMIHNKDWKNLIDTYLPITVANTFSFEDCMRCSGQLLNDSAEIQDGNLAVFMRDYAVNLMLAVRQRYKEEWKKDWKCEAFLGLCCSLVYREEEAFEYLQNALEQSKEPSQSLILAVYRVGSSPNDFLSESEKEALAIRAVQQGVTCESAWVRASCAKSKEERAYWEQQASSAELKKLHTPIIVPDVIKLIMPNIEDFSYEK